MANSEQLPPPMTPQPLTATSIGKAVRQLRQLHGMTQADLGRRAFNDGSRTSYVSTIENGLYVPNMANLEAIACAFGLRAEELLARARAWQS